MAETPPMRPLDAPRDLDAVLAALRAAEDYALLESGETPDRAAAAAYFDDGPPDHPADLLLKYGVPGRQGLDALIHIARDYPETGIWYIGLLILIPTARGQGLGTRIVSHIAAEARVRGAHRLMVCVLDENPRGLKFWQAQGFTEHRALPPRAFGQKMHARVELIRDL